MRYPPDHKQKTRIKLLEASGALAKKNGFGVSGIDELVAAADLTTGAFYKQFSSKADLLPEIVAHELQKTQRLFESDSDHPIAHAFEKYLSMFHVTHPDKGCVATTLTPEVARSTPATKQVFETQMLSIAARIASDKETQDTDKALGLMAQAMGAVMFARAVDNEDTARRILSAALAQIRAQL